MSAVLSAVTIPRKVARKVLHPLGGREVIQLRILEQVRIVTRRHGRIAVAELPRDDEERHAGSERRAGRLQPSAAPRSAILSPDPGV